MVQIDGDLRPLLRKGCGGHWQSIEAEAVGRGIPDANYCIDGVEGWVECKWTDGWTVDLRPEQIAWLMRRARAGGRVTIAVRQRNRKMKRDVLWLLDGAKADLAKRIGLNPREEQMLLGVSPGGPAKWDWEVVKRVLKRANTNGGAVS